MRLYWVRHGQMDRPGSREADLGAINRFFNQEAGRGLSERGQREADRVARFFERRRCDAVYSSPLARARQTAERTARQLGLDVATLDELRELHTGRLPEGSPEAQLVTRLTELRALPEGVRTTVLGGTLIPLYYRTWRYGRTTGGETPEQLHGRLERVFERLRASHPADAHIALFAHGYLLYHLTRRVTERTTRAKWNMRRRPYIPHGAVTEMELPASGSPRVVRYAMADHL